MKKKLALLMAAIMTIAMVPATAFASTKLTAVDEVTTGVDKMFVSRVELKKSNDQVDVEATEVDGFQVEIKLSNGKFAKASDVPDDYNAGIPLDDEDAYVNDYPHWDKDMVGINYMQVKNDTTAIVWLKAEVFNGDDVNFDACALPIFAKSVAAGDVVATFTSNVAAFKTASEVIATAIDGDVDITIDGVITFVEDSSTTTDALKDITIKELTNGGFNGGIIKLKLKGNWKFADGAENDMSVDLLNMPTNMGPSILDTERISDTEIDILYDSMVLHYSDMLAEMNISGLNVTATKKCSAGDIATITVSADDFDSVKLEVAKMVEEAVTYSVEDKDLPTIWAGKAYDPWNYDDESNTLKVSIEENTGDVINTSRKATFTFPEGIEVYGIDATGVSEANGFKYDIDENVVSIYNYAKNADETNKTDMGIKFLLNAAPTFSGDVEVTLGGQFDETTLKVATVKAPYTVEAKSSDVLIDYRNVPVEDIVITEAEDGILEEGNTIALAVQKMDFEDVGELKVTEGDIEADVDIDTINDSDDAYLLITITDASTEASTMVISGLELYLDRTLPVGGYALQNVSPWDDKVLGKDFKYNGNVFWENSWHDKEDYDENGAFKYEPLTANDEYVNVITAARDQDDSMTTKKVVITVGASTMTVGTETVTLDAPAYINTTNYTMLPLRAITEAFKATVNWEDASKTVTILSGQRIISMTIGSKTMYINGTPVAMNTAPEITSARTFIPVRDLTNALGISNINWAEASGTVTLN